MLLKKPWTRANLAKSHARMLARRANVGLPASLTPPEARVLLAVAEGRPIPRYCLSAERQAALLAAWTPRLLASPHTQTQTHADPDSASTAGPLQMDPGQADPHTDPSCTPQPAAGTPACR